MGYSLGVAGRTVGEFLSRFVLPLVAGGEMAVGRPISADELERFGTDLPYASEELVAVDEARQRVLLELVVRPPALVLDLDELHLAAAIHDLLFLAHPRVDSWGVTSSGRAKVLATAQRFASRSRTRDRIRVLARHALLHNLFDVARTDVKLSWWTGAATFYGQRPPSRLTSWRSVRRVVEEKSVATFDELFGGVDVAPVVAALLRRSPLTQLLSMSREGPALHWEDAVFVLRDAELARAVAYRAIEGDEPRQQVTAPARFAAAFEQMLERAPAEADLRAVAAFLVHLNVLLALAEADRRERSARSPLLSAVLSPERAGQRPRGLTTLFALPNALAVVEPRLAAPPGMDAEPRLARRWQQHRAQVAEAVGDGVIEALASRLRRHLTPVLPSSFGNDHGTPTEHG